MRNRPTHHSHHHSTNSCSMIMFENTIHTPIRICAVHSAAENCSQVNIKKNRMHFVLFRNPILYADAAALRGDATRPRTPCEKLAQRKLRFTQLPLMLAANALPWFHIYVWCGGGDGISLCFIWANAQWEFIVSRVRSILVIFSASSRLCVYASLF